jgi:hypothetical protein
MINNRHLRVKIMLMVSWYLTLNTDPINHSYDMVELVSTKLVSKFPLTRYGGPYRLS